jgi:hypothetical protein
VGVGVELDAGVVDPVVLVLAAVLVALVVLVGVGDVFDAVLPAVELLPVAGVVGPVAV